MEMTPSEIKANYLEAKDKKHQIQILADLNACTTQKILEILKQQGVNPRQLPRERKPKMPETGESEPVQNTASADTVVSEPSVGGDQTNKLTPKEYAIVAEVLKISRDAFSKKLQELMDMMDTMNRIIDKTEALSNET